MDEVGETLEGDTIKLYIEDDDEEDLHDYSVLLYSLGYTIYFRMDSKQAAIDLFNSMKHIKEIEAD